MAVQPLLLGRHLAERLPRSRNQKYRVVPKARLAAPLRHDLASTLALEELGRLTRRCERHHAYKSCVPGPRFAFQAVQELCRALHLCWCEAGGVQPWKASE